MTVAYTKTVQSAFLDAHDALSANETTRAALAAQTERKDKLQQVLELSDLRYRSGYSPYLEVLDSQRQLLQAQTLQIVAARNVRLAVIDTVIPRHHTGQVTGEQLEWLDELGARSDRPVLVFGHHHVWSPESRQRLETYFGINPDDSERLVDVFVRRPSLIGYFAGHTHRNRVRRFGVTGEVPWVEVACVKDFPGTWAEYRVFEGGVLQIHRRISTPEALDWTERTRVMFGGLYPQYAFGSLEDRCFAITPR